MQQFPDTSSQFRTPFESISQRMQPAPLYSTTVKRMPLVESYWILGSWSRLAARAPGADVMYEYETYPR